MVNKNWDIMDKTFPKGFVMPKSKSKALSKAKK